MFQSLFSCFPSLLILSLIPINNRYLLQYYKKSTIMQKQICSVPKFINFPYHQGEQLNAFLRIENLVDKVVDYKIKTNKQQIYLVNPMEKSIHNKQSQKILFSRKELPKQQFQAYLANPSSIQQKFLIQLKCLDNSDLSDNPKYLTQEVTVYARFIVENTKSDPDTAYIRTINSKKDEIKMLKSLITAKENQLEKLVDEEKKIKEKIQKPQQQFVLTKLDIIYLGTITLLTGFAL